LFKEQKGSNKGVVYKAAIATECLEISLVVLINRKRENPEYSLGTSPISSKSVLASLKSYQQMALRSEQIV
jgi:hypothetical protein